VFDTFAEMSSNVKDFVETSMEYGVEHLGLVSMYGGHDTEYDQDGSPAKVQGANIPGRMERPRQLYPRKDQVR
jgi:hypothetical protein